MFTTYKLYTRDGQKTHLTVSATTRKIARDSVKASGLDLIVEIPFL